MVYELTYFTALLFCTNPMKVDQRQMLGMNFIIVWFLLMVQNLRHVSEILGIDFSDSAGPAKQLLSSSSSSSVSSLLSLERCLIFLPGFLMQQTVLTPCLSLPFQQGDRTLREFNEAGLSIWGFEILNSFTSQSQALASTPASASF